MIHLLIHVWSCFLFQYRTKEDWPDQWPAVVDEFAAPVAGDEGDAALLRPLLRQTQLEFSPLGLAFDADVHGWSTERFHKQLDGMGAALVIARTEDGAVLGGYNPKASSHPSEKHRSSDTLR